MRCSKERLRVVIGRWGIPRPRWLAEYRSAWIRHDVIAGITLAAYAIPVSLAYAGLAGLPLQFGVYGYLLGGLGYAFLGSSRQLAIGPSSAISLMLAATVSEMAGGDAERYAQIASLTGFTVAALCLVAWALRLSVVVRLISDSILVGFKAGAGLTIAMTQLPSLLGVAGGGHNFLERTAMLVGQIANTHYLVLAVSVIAILLLLLGDRLLPGKPVALGVVVLSIIAASFVGLPALGVPTTGEISAGLPTLQGPTLRLRDVEGIFPLAAGCLLLAYIESISAARTFAAKHGYVVDPRQELLGLGAANLAAAMGHGFPVAGGLSQSVVNDKAGARTPLALVVASITLAKPPKGGIGCGRADRHTWTVGFSHPASDATRQPARLLCRNDCTCCCVASRNSAGHFARCAGLGIDAICPCLAPARGVSWPHSRHASVFGPRSSPGK
jgi:sulfate permease, SulP family